MWLPPLLIALACAAAGCIAFGSDDRWIHHSHGLAIIVYSRRLLWPLVTAAVLLCVAVLGLVITNRRSAWWLLGLLPIVALLGKHFENRPKQFILDNATFVAADDSRLTWIYNDWIVGFSLGDQAFALPYRALATTPIVLVTAHDKRALLLFSAAGNRAVATGIAREFKAKDLEIIAKPGGVPILYDSRLGQFIVSETGRTIDGKKPVGFTNLLTTEKVLWLDWHKTHPDTNVLLAYAPVNEVCAPANRGQDVSLIAATQPVIIRTDNLAESVINFKAADQCLLLTEWTTGDFHAFERVVGKDLFPRFTVQPNRKIPAASLVDSDTGSAWTLSGRALSGPLKGTQLKELPIETDLDWQTLKFWQPELSISDTNGH